MKSKQKNNKPRAGYYRQKAKSELRFIPGGYGTEIVELMLPSGTRRLGSILRRERTYEKTISPHLIHENTASIGINDELLESGRFDVIRIKISDRRLETTIEFFKEHSYKVCYKNFEIQRLLPIHLFGLEKAQKWLELKNAQLDMFGDKK